VVVVSIEWVFKIALVILQIIKYITIYSVSGSSSKVIVLRLVVKSLGSVVVSMIRQYCRQNDSTSTSHRGPVASTVPSSA
jgi:hypothetical protein